MVTDRPKRIASHPDDPGAPFADRLLLALGIWPHHAEQAGVESVLDAVVMIRTDAHKYPMVVEDYGVLRERLEALEEIRQRVADGWAAFPADGYYEAAIWYRPSDDGFAKLTPEVAAVLWPSTEEEQ